MADPENFEVDPAIAEAMGFSGFGMQNRKRKFDTSDAYVAPPKQSKESQYNQNGETERSVPSADVGETTQEEQSRPVADGDGMNQHVTGDPMQDSTFSSIGNDTVKESRLEALRHGIRNENGDMVYFLPSFIEDPWKNLRPR